MNKNHRVDLLSLNLKEIKKSLPSALQTKLIVSEENEDNEPLPQNIIKPWMLSLYNQTFVSRNKVGQELLHHCRNGFALDDPYIRKTRFYVDYHRMHDPGLKSYYTSIPVKNRMKKLGFLTEGNDAICSSKEFVDYLRYLDTNINYNLTQEKEINSKRRLFEHFKMLKEEKDQEFTGIFLRKKQKFVRRPSESFEVKRLKLDKIIKKEKKAIEKVAKLMEEKSDRVKEFNQAKIDKFIPKKLMMDQNESRKRNKMIETIKEKLELAKNRRGYMSMEKRIKRISEQIDYCKKHSAFRQEIFRKNIKLYEMYEEEQRKNVEERKKDFEKVREYNERRIIRIRKEIARKKRNAESIDKIMKNLEQFQKKCMKSAAESSIDLKEVSRRLELFKKPFIDDCAEILSSTLQCLNISVPSAAFAATTIKIMENRSIIIPEIGTSKCVSVQNQVAEIIADTINHMYNERYKEIIDKSQIKPCNNEFIGDLCEIPGNVDIVIETELDRLVEIFCKNKFDYSSRFDGRDFVHVYDFQKYFINESIKLFMEYVQINQQYYWTQIKDLKAWILLSKTYSKINLWDTSLEAADQVMNFPNNYEDFCECVKKVSKFICVLINNRLN